MVASRRCPRLFARCSPCVCTLHASTLIACANHPHECMHVPTAARPDPPRPTCREYNYSSEMIYSWLRSPPAGLFPIPTDFAAWPSNVSRWLDPPLGPPVPSTGSLRAHPLAQTADRPSADGRGAPSARSCSCLAVTEIVNGREVDRVSCVVDGMPMRHVMSCAECECSAEHAGRSDDGVQSEVSAVSTAALGAASAPEVATPVGVIGSSALQPRGLD